MQASVTLSRALSSLVCLIMTGKRRAPRAQHSPATDGQRDNKSIHRQASFTTCFRALPNEVINQIMGHVLQRFFVPIGKNNDGYLKRYREATAKLEGLCDGNWRAMYYWNNRFVLDERDPSTSESVWRDYLATAEEYDCVEHIRHLMFYFTQARILVDVITERDGGLQLQFQVKMQRYEVPANAKLADEEEKTKLANELKGLLAPGLERIESNIGAKLKVEDFMAVRRLVNSAFAKILR